MVKKKNATVAVVPVAKKEEGIVDVHGVPQELATYERQRASVEAMITQAIEKGMDVETMKEILAMRTTLRAEWAKEQFDRAMADCQAEMPVIGKSKMARDENKGKDLYKYAPLDAIVAVAGPIIAKHGFSYSFKTLNAIDKVKVTCIVKHRDGHSEESDMETALSTKTQIMSAPQQIAATVTFNKRYAFTNAFGITTGGEDDENQLVETVAPVAPANLPSLKMLREMMRDANSNEATVCQRMHVAKLEDLDERGLKILEKSLLEKLGPDYVYIPVVVPE